MPITPTFDSISLADLSSVQGGCGKKQCQCPPPAPPPQAPPPAPAAAPMGGTEITTNVQMTGFGASAQ
jgi:hypothetical protein